MHNSENKISLESFKSYNSYDVFTRYIGKNPPIGKAIVSPLRDEKNPSFSVFKDPATHEYLFKDHGSGESGDCIKFVELKCNTDFKGAIELLQQEYNCIIGDDPLPQPVLINSTPVIIPPKPASTSKSYEIKERTKFNQQEVVYFIQYKIKSKVLKDFNVIALDGYTLANGTTINRKENELMFCYKHENWAKIYKPNSPDRKFRFQHLGTKEKDFIFGENQLPETGDVLIITGGEKDVLTLWSFDYYAVTLNSESASLGKAKAIVFKARFKEVIVLYDIDETGIKLSLKLCQEYGFKRAMLPLSLISEGGKDISDFIKFNHTPDELNQIITDAEVIPKADIKNNLFLVKPLNSFLMESKSKPSPEKLFDEFWFEGETCIMFSDTNLGKSTLALQIADSITTGYAIQGFEFTAAKQKVLYIDFELSSKQLELRYSDGDNNAYQFDENLLRATIDLDSLQEGNSQVSDDMVLRSIEEVIASTDAKVIIIDNLTYLANETEKAKTALPLMKRIHYVKLKYDLSILALGHTPKRDQSKPMTKNDLQGSKMYINFCDSSFAINQSFKDSGLKYLKQIKVRNAEFKYDTENVAVCSLAKSDKFLGFELLGHSYEREHLKQLSEKAISEMEQMICDLKCDKPYLSNREIAKQLDINHSKVNRVLRKKEESE